MLWKRTPKYTSIPICNQNIFCHSVPDCIFMFHERAATRHLPFVNQIYLHVPSFPESTSDPETLLKEYSFKCHSSPVHPSNFIRSFASFHAQACYLPSGSQLHAASKNQDVPVIRSAAVKFQSNPAQSSSVLLNEVRPTWCGSGKKFEQQRESPDELCLCSASSICLASLFSL